MRLSAYPQCCKANVLHDFGYGHVNETGPQHKSATKEQVLDYLNKTVPQLVNSGIQVLFACPTNHQTGAIEALTEFGFFGAPDEELLEVAHIENALKYDENGEALYDLELRQRNGYDSYLMEEVVHQMVPMFFLVPPHPSFKKYKGSDLHKADLAKAQES